jgi:hypothetical protein
MKRETYERALRSASQISFLSLPLVTACGSTYEPVIDAGSSGHGYGDGDGHGDEGDDDGDAPIDCAKALKAAYPNGDPNWYNSAEPTPRVDTGVPVATLVQCCIDNPPTDADFAGGAGSYRESGCCSLNNETDGAIANLGLACTPWGPPMPRAMRRREVLS